MNSKRVGLLFIVIGIMAISSFLLYSFVSEKTDNAVPVLKSFSDSSNISENEAAEGSDDKPSEKILRTNDETLTETASAVKFPVDINTATVEELALIEGIGNAIAENIVEYRESVGYFHSVEELLKVDNIGDKRLALIKDYIYIDQELFSETAVLPSETYSTAVTTVPQKYSETSSETVKTAVTVSVEAEEEDTD